MRALSHEQQSTREKFRYYSFMYEWTYLEKREERKCCVLRSAYGGSGITRGLPVPVSPIYLHSFG